jgi:N6-adenosine-specific RNA methylase IME4
MSEFPTVVADPPWPYKETGRQLQTASKGLNPDGRGANISSEQRYGKMTVPEICSLRVPAADNAHLYLWTTNAFLMEAHEVARAWGFEQKTMITWVKVRRDDPTKISRKAGYYFRGATEHCLFCVRGSLRLQTKEALATAFLSPRLPHSWKPDVFYATVEKASPGPYLEMFARRARLGPWDYWGNESLQTVELERAA